MTEAMLDAYGLHLEKVAKVLVLEKPELVPILKNGVVALAKFMAEVERDRRA